MQLNLWQYIYILLCLISIGSADFIDFLLSSIRYFSDSMIYTFNDPPDAKNIRSAYDFIIVGGGSAGCVLANRLTEREDWRVLLLEAGPSEIMAMNIPIMAPMLQYTSFTDMYKSEPTEFACLSIKDRRCVLPRGKVLAGSSSINFMIYARGDASDYDNWANMGNVGWSWNDVFKYFIKSEDMRIKENWVDPKYHGYNGYLSVDTPNYRTPLAFAFVEAGKELGYDLRDYNSGNISGFSYIQSTTKNGSRMSTSQAFLLPIRDRKNLDIVKLATVTKILIENYRAIGVEYIKSDRKFIIKAKKEVILSAGAINSPQLLMLSGIGPRDHLQSLGIKVVKNLPVGYNLMDHPVIGNVIFTVDKPVSFVENQIYDWAVFEEYLTKRSGPLTSIGTVEGLAFIDVFNPNNMMSRPNLEIQFCSSSPLSFQFYNDLLQIDKETKYIYKTNNVIHSYLMFMTVMRPKSRGKITLRNIDPLDKPKIDIGFLTHINDVEILVKSVEFAKNLSQTKAFSEFHPKIYDRPIPKCAKYGRDTKAYWTCHARHLTITNYHQCGTAKMGPVGDQTAVVDPRLRVHGIKRLRVIDASIMPMITSANTNAPVIMIAEKGADMIKEDWSATGSKKVLKQ